MRVAHSLIFRVFSPAEYLLELRHSRIREEESLIIQRYRWRGWHVRVSLAEEMRDVGLPNHREGPGRHGVRGVKKGTREWRENGERTERERRENGERTERGETRRDSVQAGGTYGSSLK